MTCVGHALVPRGDALAFHVGTCERERHKSGGLRHHFGSLAVASRPLDIPKHGMPGRDKKIRFTWPSEPRTHHQRENDPPELRNIARYEGAGHYPCIGECPIQHH